jgi:hypothetical protein
MLTPTRRAPLATAAAALLPVAVAVALAALAAPASAGPAARGITEACTWDRPGHNPFMGDVVAAVDRYQDIPGTTRAKLKARMAARQYDEIATIRRDSITGRARYAPEIRDMHFGQGQLCRSVTRAGWAPTMQELGLVYCEDGHCILVPTVCRNVSRIQRIEPATPRPAQPQQADEGPIDITPSAGGWGARGDQAASGPGLRLPVLTPPADLAPAAPAAAPLLASNPAEADAAGPAMPLAWLDRPLPALTPEPAPLLLPSPTPPVPEPAGLALMALGAAAIFITARNRTARSHP